MDQEHSASFVVLIPAFRPTGALLEVVDELARRNLAPIVVVDDGSGVEYADVFARVAKIPNVHVVRHAVNLGKGAALKTGMNFAVCAFPGLVGVVTADADGQHLPGDIERVARRLLENPSSLVLGSRGFDGKVPFRSRFGNVITRHAVRALVGHNLTDTQTGLRGVPLRMIPWLLRIDARGYEFEFEMLILARRMPVRIVEETISTVYEPGNPSSHFNPLIDSAKIYFVLLRFSSVSLLTAVLDNVVFYLALRQTGQILASQIIGRIAAVAFNYVMVRRAVFASTERHRATLPRFLLLVLVSGTISYSGIRLLSDRLGMNPMAAKILVESLLFFVNFVIQRVFIFSNELVPEGPPRSG